MGVDETMAMIHKVGRELGKLKESTFAQAHLVQYLALYTAGRCSVQVSAPLLVPLEGSSDGRVLSRTLTLTPRSPSNQAMGHTDLQELQLKPFGQIQMCYIYLNTKCDSVSYF